jgi:formate hydrogenlyase subunit 4
MTVPVPHSRISLNRSALTITVTELKLIAAAATMGLISTPSHGYNTPAATGTTTVNLHLVVILSSIFPYILPLFPIPHLSSV